MQIVSVPDESVISDNKQLVGLKQTVSYVQSVTADAPAVSVADDAPASDNLVSTCGNIPAEFCHAVAEACQLFDESLFDPPSEFRDTGVERSTVEEHATHVPLSVFGYSILVDPPDFAETAVSKPTLAFFSGQQATGGSFHVT